MNRKFGKKFGGLFLALIMIMSILPTTALAAPTPSATIEDGSIDLTIGTDYAGKETLVIKLTNMTYSGDVGRSTPLGSNSVIPDGLHAILNVIAADELLLILQGNPTTEVSGPITISIPGGYFADRDGGSVGADTPVTVNPNAVWNIKKPVYYNINAAADENGTVVASAEKAVEGDTVTLTATPNEGYKFKEWQSEDVTVENDKFIMPANDVTVHAIFEKAVFAVTVTSDENGTASATPRTALEGDEVTLTATPNEGYTFKEWQSEDVTVENDKFIMPARNVTVKAIFEVISQPTEEPTPAPTEEPVVTPTPEVPNDTPKTGDSENILFVALLLITISAAGILILKKRSSNK